MSESESRVTRMLGPLSSGLAKLWSMARSAFMDMRDSGAGKRAASAVHDLQESDATKRAQGALHDLRRSDAVRKAEETARRTVHDLRSGGGGSSSSGTPVG
jgi:hypothetical protein